METAHVTMSLSQPHNVALTDGKSREENATDGAGRGGSIRREPWRLLCNPAFLPQERETEK